METIAKITTETKAKAVVLDESAQALVNELVDLRLQATAIRKRNEEITQVLKGILGDAELGLVDDRVRVSVSRYASRSTDFDAFESAFPELFKLFVKETAQSRLNIK